MKPPTASDFVGLANTDVCHNCW